MVLLLVWLVPALTLGGLVAVAARLALARLGSPPRRANASAAVAGSAAAVTWLVFGLDWLAYSLDETGPSPSPLSPYAEYRRTVVGDSAIAVGSAYSLVAGGLVVLAAWLYGRATSATWTAAALIAAASISLPATVPAALPRTPPRAEPVRDPVYYVSQPAYEDLNSGQVGLCVAYGLEPGAEAGPASESDPELCFVFAPTARARDLAKGDATALVDELNESSVRPHDRADDLDIEGLEVLRSGWRDAPGSAANPPFIAEPPGEERRLSDRLTKSHALRLARHMTACGAAFESYLPCTEPAKLRAVGVPIGAAASQVEISGVSSDDFVVTGHSRLGHHFTVGRSDGRELPRTCDPPGRGGCPAGGRW
jgi:hypothetical protein